MCTPTVFLSHASNDRPLVDAVCDLLRDGISQLNLQEVFCTSLDGQGIAPGRDSTSDIKRALLDSAIVIFLISPAFKQSAFCANEVGAAWAIRGLLRTPARPR